MHTRMICILHSLLNSKPAERKKKRPQKYNERPRDSGNSVEGEERDGREPMQRLPDVGLNQKLRHFFHASARAVSHKHVMFCARGPRHRRHPEIDSQSQLYIQKLGI